MTGEEVPGNEFGYSVEIDGLGTLDVTYPDESVPNIYGGLLEDLADTLSTDGDLSGIVDYLKALSGADGLTVRVTQEDDFRISFTVIGGSLAIEADRDSIRLLEDALRLDDDSSEP